MKKVLTNIEDAPRIAEFVAGRLGVSSPIHFGPYNAIGIERDGEVIAGAIYCDCNGRNAWVHMAGIPGRHWITREFIRIGFDYPFNQLGLTRISGWVEASNTDAIKMNHHLGYRIEAVLRGAARDGGDVFIMVMFRDKCRYIRQGAS